MGTVPNQVRRGLRAKLWGAPTLRSLVTAIRRAPRSQIGYELCRALWPVALAGHTHQVLALAALLDDERLPQPVNARAPNLAALTLAAGLPYGGMTAERHTTVAAFFDAQKRTALTDSGRRPDPNPWDGKGVPDPGIDGVTFQLWCRRAMPLMVPAPDGARPPTYGRGAEILRALAATGRRTWPPGTLALIADERMQAGDEAGALAILREIVAVPDEPAFGPVLSLTSLAPLVAAGALCPPSFGTDKAADFARAVVTALDDWAASDLPLALPRARHEILTLYSQFYLEPREPTDRRVPEREEIENGWALMPSGGVALFTPGEGDVCAVELRIGRYAPSTKAIQVLRFPLEARGDLFLRGVVDDEDDHSFAVPPGQYDVEVAFLSKRSIDYMEHWRVRVTMSPSHNS